MEETLRELIGQINKRLDAIEICQKNIDINLNNHIHTLDVNIASMSKEIEWIKDGLLKHFEREEKLKIDKLDVGKESKEDIKTQQDVDWLKRFFWMGISLAITSVVSLATMLLHILAPFKA